MRKSRLCTAIFLLGCALQVRAQTPARSTLLTKDATIRLEKVGDVQHVTFALSNTVSLTGIVEHTDDPIPGAHSWSGRLEGTTGDFTIVEYQNRRSANVHVPGKMYEITPARQRGAFVVREIKTDGLPECGNERGPRSLTSADSEIWDSCPSRPATPTARDSSACASDPVNTHPPVIDALVVYTKALRQLISRVAVQERILHNIEETNLSFKRSGVKTYVRLARDGNMPCMLEVSGASSHDVVTDLFRLIQTSDGVFTKVHYFRRICKADVTLLLAEEYDKGGRACLMYTFNPDYKYYAFGVVNALTASTRYAFTHELGHIMGAGHDVENDGPGLCRDSAAGWLSAGWRFRLLGMNFRTVMAYEPGIETIFFSNPDVSVLGTRTGHSTKANNARTLRITSGLVSQYWP